MSEPVQDEIVQALGTGIAATSYIILKNLFQYLGSYWMIRVGFYFTVVGCTFSVLRTIEKCFKNLEKRVVSKKSVATAPAVAAENNTVPM